ncbi:MAG: hypothetical protein ACI4L7_03265 [Christensenellales bacterium]
MTISDLAPWIAISITLALSILVPLFTQIANNKHQRQLQKDKFEYEKMQKKNKVFEDFLLNVGGAITYAKQENLISAGSSLYNIYLYAPKEWYADLDELAVLIQKYEWDKATIIIQKISRLMAEELNK